jgi:CheY-like chemotaxis protein
VERDPLPLLKTVLLVDDGDTNRVTTKWFLTNFGYEVDCVRSAEEALALFDPRLHDLVVTENLMPGMTGVEMAHIIKLRSSCTPVLMYTRTPPDQQSCLDAILQKPTHPLEVIDTLDELLAHKEHKLTV